MTSKLLGFGTLEIVKGKRIKFKLFIIELELVHFHLPVEFCLVNTKPGLSKAHTRHRLHSSSCMFSDVARLSEVLGNVQ